MLAALLAASGAALVGAAAGLAGSRLAGAWAAVRPVPAMVLKVPAPLTAGVSAAVWAGIVWRWGAVPGTLPLLGLGWVVLTAADIDLRSHVIPDRLTLRAAAALAVAVALVGQGPVAIVPAGLPVAGLASAAILSLVLPALLLVTSLAFRAVRGEAGIGLGDVKLALPIGLVLGWLGPAYVVVALLGTFVSAGAVTGLLLALRRLTVGDRVPFGPYLALGTLSALIGGERAVSLVGLMTVG